MATVFDSPLAVRLACRENRLTTYASEALAGFLCVNVVMMDRAYADEFADFCHRNPDSCPLLHVIPAGQTAAPAFAAELDIRTDLRSYDVIRHGENLGSRPEVSALFTDRTVTFLIGSSVSLDGYLTEQNLGPDWGPCIYLTTRPCRPVGPYAGNIAVTMRAYPATVADQVAERTAHFPACHGGPIARNDPASLGISDETAFFLPARDPAMPDPSLDKLYWPCGITPSLVAKAAKLPLMIVHTPGNALMTDIRTSDLYDRFDLVAGVQKPG